MSTLIDSAVSGLKTVYSWVANAVTMKNYASPLTLADASKLLRIEPRVVVSPDVLNHQSITPIMQSILSLYSACWLLAADLMFKVRDCRTVRTLDALNPKRDGTGWIMLATFENLNNNRMEGYKYSLPYPGLKTRMENAPRIHGDKELQSFVNLSVGRMLEVQFEEPKTRADGEPIITEEMVTKSIRVNVRLNVTSAPEEVLGAIMSGGSVPRGWAERWRAIMAGELDFIADGIFMRDIYNQRMKLGVIDRGELQQAIREEQMKNKAFGVLTRSPSMADASNIFVISTEFVQRYIKPKFGGMLTDERVRKKLFEFCPVMVIAEVDREKNQTRFYIRGEADYALVKDSEMKQYDSKGPDVMEVLGALQTSSFNRF